MGDQYEYQGLSDKAKYFIVKKFKEIPEEVNEHIERFRELLKSKPHLNIPTDSNFLLKFLRIAKFDLQKAEAKLDNFCTLKSSAVGVPGYFDHVQVDDPMVEEFLSKPIVLPLGKNEDEELVVLLRFGAWNPDTIPLKGFFNLALMSLDLMMVEEEAKLYGVKFIYDLTDAPKCSIDIFSDPTIIKNINRVLHESHVIRLKGEIIYNEPELCDGTYNLYTFFKNEKKKSRIIRVKGDIKDLAEKVPGIEKLMPKEYGGEGSPICELAEAWKNKFKDYFKDGDPRPCVSVDECKRPEGTCCFLSDFGEYVCPRIEKEKKSCNIQ